MLIISNPKAGDGQSSQFIREKVIPLLEHLKQPSEGEIQVVETQAAGDAGNIAYSYLQEVHQDQTAIIVISGGDTSVHEVLNRIATEDRKVTLIIVPSGTANALYHSLFPPNQRDAFKAKFTEQVKQEFLSLNEQDQLKLYSVAHFLLKDEPIEMTLTRTSVVGPDGKNVSSLISCVVVSSGKASRSH